MVRVVCVSDTHSLVEKMVHPVPAGDVLIHAGDFSHCGLPHEVEAFNDWLGSLPHKHKIVIAGNHEITFDSNVHPDELKAKAGRYGNKRLVYRSFRLGLWKSCCGGGEKDFF